VSELPYTVLEGPPVKTDHPTFGNLPKPIYGLSDLVPMYTNFAALCSGRPCPCPQCRGDMAYFETCKAFRCHACELVFTKFMFLQYGHKPDILLAAAKRDKLLWELEEKFMDDLIDGEIERMRAMHSAEPIDLAAVVAKGPPLLLLDRKDFEAEVDRLCERFVAGELSKPDGLAVKVLNEWPTPEQTWHVAGDEWGEPLPAAAETDDVTPTIVVNG
jgi:hypothetical protein